MSVERHHSQEENVGAYLLGALTEIELRAFEHHLDECPLCRDEVERLRPAVEALPRSVPPVEPPATLKASLMEAVMADVGVQPGEPRAADEPRARRLASLRGGRGRARSRMRPRLAWVAAAFVLVAAGAFTGYAVTEIGSDGGQGSQRLAAKIDKGRVPFGSGSLVVPGEREKGAILRVHGMPTLDESSVYQVWLKRNGETISASLFSVGPDGDGAAAIAEDLNDADAVLVTRERAGGARAPTEAPVLSVPL